MSDDCLFYHGDWLELAKTLPDESIDILLTDPPYSDHVQTTIRTRESMKDFHQGRAAEATRRRYFDFESISNDDMLNLAREAKRLVKRWSMVFCNVEISHLWRAAFEAEGLEYIRTMLWIKRNAPPQFTGDRPAPGYECIMLFHPKGRKSWNSGGKHGIYDHLTVNDRSHKGNVRLHPAQKPESLIAELINDFSMPGETVADFYSGSGTTAKVCLRTGRKFVGAEAKEEYYQGAYNRLFEARAQGSFLLASDQTPAKQSKLF